MLTGGQYLLGSCRTQAAICIEPKSVEDSRLPVRSSRSKTETEAVAIAVAGRGRSKSRKWRRSQGRNRKERSPTVVGAQQVKEQEKMSRKRRLKKGK